MILRYIFKAMVFIAVAIAAYLLFQTLRQYTVAQIYDALLAIPASNLALSLAFAAASYFCLSFFDALGVRYIGKPLPLHQTMLASFVSLSIGHNVGVAALSSAAVRYRYYSRWGLSSADVALIVVFCGVTVALGLSTLGSLALFLRPQDAMSMTGLGPTAIMAVAAIAALIPLCYVGLSAVLSRSITLRGRSFRLPTLKIAALQVLVGTTNFAFVAASLHQMLSALSDANYLKVAAVSIIANVAAIVSHIPGGIGVLEATVSHILPGAEALAAVIAFRVVYYFIPLGLGLVLLGASEVVIADEPELEKHPQKT
jgi:uncharacterized membrane protein YbhN (UPF0104 family)